MTVDTNGNEMCSSCGKRARVVRSSYGFDESGLPVMLQGIEVIRCRSCGNEDPIIPNVDELMGVIALAVIYKPWRLEGKEVKYLRKYLRMTAQEFSRLVGVDKATISRWENNVDKIGPHSDRLIRLIAFSLGDGLQDQLEELIKYLPSIHNESRSVGIQMDANTLKYEYA